MMSQNNVKLSRLATSNIYNLKTIFSGENDKIVIPDMQRDYCWGEKGLVANFLDTIIDMDKSQAITMGLLYGYVNPLSPEHIQLCDGQQRLTTLFLLIGMINKKLQGNPYQHLLISDFELNGDDKEPYLQYSIRESSLYFLSDLTYNFFLNKDNSYTVEEISNQPWFLNSYQLDPTIRNIIDALRTIDDKLKFMEEEGLAELGEFVTTKIEFLYHDMGDRVNGEETFVIINTTGEPLTANQNLKPLFIEENGMIDGVAEMWEDMETWFWQNRRRGKNHTADQGMKEFFRAVRIICANDKETLEAQIKDKGSTFPYKSIDGATVFDYFEAYKKIYGKDYNARKDGNCEYTGENGEPGYTDNYLFVLLPVLAYCRRFTDAAPTDIKRIYHLFSNMSRYRSNETSLLWGYLQSIETMADKDVCSLMECERISKEEQRKLRIIALQPSEKREGVELLFAEAEAHKIFDGQISLLLDWSEEDIVSFEHYLKRVKQFWAGECDNKIDHLRRALLSYGLENYPVTIKKKNRCDETLGWDWEDWPVIFSQNKDKIKQFLDDERTIDEIINDFTDESSIFYPIIKDRRYLSESERKTVHINKKINAFVLFKKILYRAGALLFIGGKEYPDLKGGWTNFRIDDESIYATHEKGLDIHYYFDGNKYLTRLYQRGYPNKEKLDSITELGLIAHEDQETSYQNYWETEPEENWETAKAKMEEVAKWVDNNIG